MLIIINIWRILKSPAASVNGYRDNTVILSCRMIHSSRITFIFYAKLALWICTLLCILGCCDCLRVFLWFWQINRDINNAIGTVHCPFHIFLDTIFSYVIAVLAKFIKIICCIFRIFFIIGIKNLFYCTWSWSHNSHQLCIKQISCDNIITLNDSLFKCNICQFI